MGACIQAKEGHRALKFEASSLKRKQFAVNGQHYRVIRELAEGGFAYVLYVESASSGKRHAVKVMILQTKEAYDLFHNEVQTLSKLREATHTIRMFDYCLTCERNITVGRIVLELGDMTLLTLLKALPAGTNLPVSETIRILTGLLKGIQEMHLHGYTHRDIKPENVLFVGEEIKLCDFGSASSYSIDTQKYSGTYLQRYEEYFDRTTTLISRPPEMIDTRRGWPIDSRVDLWMFGCVVFLLTYGRHPFAYQGKLAIVNASYKLDKVYDKDPRLILIIQGVLVPDPRLRPSTYQLLVILQGASSKQEGSYWGDYN